MNVRKPTVAGAFYPGTSEEITQLVDRIFESEKENIDLSFSEREIIGCVVPHAGYVYSAYEAVHFFEIIRKSNKQYDTFLIINPNHTGYGQYIEVDASDSWDTPMGNVPIDTELARALDLPLALRAQQQEHSAEVMLPLLQKFLPYDFKVLPVSILRQNPASAIELAEKIRNANAKLNRSLMIIASSDFSHFESPADGKRKDDLVLEQIKKQDSEKLYDTVIQNRISVCGYGPIMTLIEYSRLISGNPQSTILARGNSGKTRPSNSVVDYITILFYS
ncbi:AmmeMemoRadiSam system protein B [Bacteroidota bacterium]